MNVVMPLCRVEHVAHAALGIGWLLNILYSAHNSHPTMLKALPLQTVIHYSQFQCSNYA